MQASEFGRTMVSNGMGTDHGWGGMHWIAGGSVDGGKFFGKYPESLLPESDLMLSRGRIVPTTGWEALWQVSASTLVHLRAAGFD